MRVTMQLTTRAFADLCRARALLQSRRRVGIREAAAAARLSPFQFIRRFKALFGEKKQAGAAPVETLPERSRSRLWALGFGRLMAEASSCLWPARAQSPKPKADKDQIA